MRVRGTSPPNTSALGMGRHRRPLALVGAGVVGVPRRQLAQHRRTASINGAALPHCSRQHQHLGGHAVEAAVVQLHRHRCSAW